MYVQVLAVAALRSVLRRERALAPTYNRTIQGQRLLYVIAACPKPYSGNLYGTLPWNQAHATKAFRERVNKGE